MVAAASVYATHRSTVVKLDFMSDNCRCVRSTLVFLGCRTWPTQNHSSCGNVNGACLGPARGAVGALVAPYENRTPGGLGAPYENRTSGAASPPPPPHAPPPRPYAGRAQPRTAEETVTVPVRGKSESLSVPVQYTLLYRLPRSLFTGQSIRYSLQNGEEPFS